MYCAYRASGAWSATLLCAMLGWVRWKQAVQTLEAFLRSFHVTLITGFAESILHKDHGRHHAFACSRPRMFRHEFCDVRLNGSRMNKDLERLPPFCLLTFANGCWQRLQLPSK